MADFLKGIVAAYEAVDASQFREPDVELTPQDTVLGECDEELRRLFTLSGQAVDQVDRVHKRALRVYIDHEGDEPPPGLDELQLEHTLALLMSKLFRSLFWTAVKTKFPQALKPDSVGIRKGWKIVAITEEEEEEGSSPLAAILAGALLAGLK